MTEQGKPRRTGFAFSITACMPDHGFAASAAHLQLADFLCSVIESQQPFLIGYYSRQ
jgi:hypothetical protein